MKKEIMKRAWEIARTASRLHGESSKVFFSESLKIAWAEFKKYETGTVSIDGEYAIITLKDGKTFKKHNRDYGLKAGQRVGYNKVFFIGRAVYLIEYAA